MGTEDKTGCDEQLDGNTVPASTGDDGGLFAKLKDRVYRKKCLRTFWLGATFLALGFGIGQRGPAFLDIQIITRTDVESASFFFTSGSIGYLVGSLVAGVIYDKLNKSVLLFGSVLGLAAATIATPWCSPYGLMITAFFLSALFGGAIDTAGNAELLRIWGKEGEVAMQSLHFAFALGGVISPLFTEPFLTPNPEDEGHGRSSGTTPSGVENTSMDFNSSTDSILEQSNVTNNSTQQLPLTTNVHYAYMICGVIIFFTAIPMIVEWFQERSEKRRQDKKDEKNVKQPLPLALFLFVQFVLCLFYYLYCSVEDSFAAYLTTFVVKELHWTKSNGAKVTSVFWASFASGRFLSIFIVKLLSAVTLIIACCLTLIASMLGFMLTSEYSATVGVWFCSAGAGLTMSAIFASGFTWMEMELVRVTGRVAASILIASSAGTMVNPIVLGYLMEEVDNMWFPYLLFAESCLVFLVFVFLLAFSRLYLQKRYAVREGGAVPEVALPTLELEIPPPEPDGHPATNSAM